MAGGLEDLLRMSQGVPSGAARGVQPGQGQQVAQPRAPLTRPAGQPNPTGGLPPEILRLIQMVLANRQQRDPNALANAALQGVNRAAPAPTGGGILGMMG